MPTVSKVKTSYKNQIDLQDCWVLALSEPLQAQMYLAGFRLGSCWRTALGLPEHPARRPGQKRFRLQYLPPTVAAARVSNPPKKNPQQTNQTVASVYFHLACLRIACNCLIFFLYSNDIKRCTSFIF